MMNDVENLASGYRHFYENQASDNSNNEGSSNEDLEEDFEVDNFDFKNKKMKKNPK